MNTCARSFVPGDGAVFGPRSRGLRLFHGGVTEP